MIIDCFVFGDELDVLEVRLDYLDPVVDRFVLVESPLSFSGRPKPRVFEENLSRFERWLPKVVAVELPSLPAPDPTRWVPEAFQRNNVLLGLDQIGAGSDDVVIVADVDEIPYADAVRDAAETIARGAASVTFQLSTSQFFGNWVDPTSTIDVTKAFRRSALTSPHHQRMFERPDAVIRDAGRHISTLLTPDQVSRKISNVAHSERDNPRDASLRHLELCRIYGVEMLGRSLLQQVDSESLDPILSRLGSLRPDLIAVAPMPPLATRRRYLAITRARRYFAPDGVMVRALDRFAGSRAAGSLASALALGLRAWRWVPARRARKRRAEQRRLYLAAASCEPAKLCGVCTGEV